MIANEMAIKGFPMLRLEDTASFVLQCMEDYEVQHLPLLKDEYFIGLVSKESVLDIAVDQTMASIAEGLPRIGVNGGAHFTKALELFSKHELSLLPVLNEQQECVGVITQKILNENIARFIGTEQNGAIIVLSISPYQYSLAEMSRLVETNNAQILQLNSFFEPATGAMIITIKINKEEASAIISTFERYDYQVLHYFGKSPLHNDIESHYQHLMNYLDV
jgi:predicted transcriptional regulator